MKHSWLLSVVVCVSAALAERPALPEPAPDFHILAILYREFGLPLPPPDAPLARIPTGWQEVQDNGKDKPLYALGFVLNPATATAPAEILVGPCRSKFEPSKSDGPLKILPAEKVKVEDLTFEWNTTFPLNPGPALAVQCFLRGHTDLAGKLLAASKKILRGSGPIAVSSGGAWMKHRETVSYIGRPGDHAEVLLGGVAWSYWLNEIVKPDTDWKTALDAMRRIVATVPELNDAPRKATLTSLAAALEPRRSKPGSIEAAIDDLVDCRHTISDLGGNEKPDPAYDKLLLMGFAAVPTLIEHLDDNRLTRSVMTGFNNFPTMTRRVGELVSDLLSDLIAEAENDDWLKRQLGRTLEKERAENWWKTAQEIGEEKYLRTRVLPRSRDAELPHEPHLKIIAQRYARQLPEIYREILDKRPEIQSWSVTEAIGRSTLPREDKLRLFQYGASRQKLALRKPALHQLRSLDPAAVDTILLSILEKLPRKTRQPVWTSEEAGVSHLVKESRSDQVWTAFATTLKRSHVSLRLELMNSLDYSDAGDAPRAHRLKLLSQFLDDTTERIIKDGDKLYDGPCAAFTFPRIAVRDFAAMQLASLLEFSDEPEVEWSPKRWSDFRQKVRAALSRKIG